MTLRPRRPSSAAAAVVLAALAASACTGQAESTPPPAPTPPAAASTPGAGLTDPAARPELARFYDQRLTWEACGDVQCATLTVPVDWDSPDGDTLELALTRSQAEGERVGSLMFNPGGPGVGARETVSAYRQVLGPALADAFDFVGMDPRGVGESAPVACLDDAQKEELYAEDSSPDANTPIEEVAASAAAFGQACDDRNGDLLNHMGTLSVVKDLDVLRAAVDEEVLTYWGASYGTFIGAWYAQVFPWRVGRLVLDGAVDPSLNSALYTEGQAEGFARGLRSYVQDCQAGAGCPLRGTVDEGLAQLGRLVEAADTAPLRTDGGRELTQALMVTGIIQGLYAEQLWPLLTEGLGQAIEGDGTQLMALADLYLEREPDGSYGQTFDAFPAVFCLDRPEERTLEEISADAAQIAADYPPLGSEMGYSGLTCRDWPVDAELEPTRLTADGAAPILVIGTVGDTATPYRWAESLADQLSSGVLLTYEGEGHTAFRRGSECIDDAVRAYLFAGTLPEAGTRCPAAS